MADSIFELPNQKISVANIEVEILVANEYHESRSEPQSETPVSKGKKRTRRVIEEDELCQDDPWDVDGINAPQTSYKPRPTKRRSVAARDFVSVENNEDTIEDTQNDQMPPTQSPPKLPASALPDTDPVEPPPDAAPEAPPEALPEVPPEAAPKKRGRKKKQPVPDVSPTEAEVHDDSQLNQTCASPDKVATVEPSPEKPKKRRGRPRKSELPKSVEESPPEPPIADELPETNLPRDDSTLDESGAAITKQKDSKGKTRKRRNAIEEEEPLDSDESRLPLKEVDNNTRSPSKSVSARGSPEKASAELGDKIQTPKAQPRETPMLGASQSKVRYRVGLSKRSRIAPLLKSIRK